MNSGKYIFSQVIDYIPMYEFEKLVKKYDEDKRTKMKDGELIILVESQRE